MYLTPVILQVTGKVPTISIDKTDGCMVYLSDKSLDVEIVTAKSSEMNVLVPVGDGDYVSVDSLLPLHSSLFNVLVSLCGGGGAIM